MSDGLMALSRKRKTKDPCPGCFLHRSLCICEIIPFLETRTRLSLIVHAKELKRTTNTGRLAVKALKNSAIYIRGIEGQPLDFSSVLSDQEQALFFYPTDDAIELTPDFVRSFSKPIHLIVPDGNWRQASKVHTRHPELRTIPRVKISTPNISVHHLRKETTEEGMATLQAIAHAYRAIEGEEVFQALIKVYEAKLRATLRGRGQLVADG
jgi:DTW domain-containing protein YfiP